MTNTSEPNSVLYSANNNYIKQFSSDSSSFISSVSPISPVSPTSLLLSHFVDANHGNLNTDELLEANKQRKKLNQDLNQDTERWCDTFLFPRIVSQLSPLSFQVRSDLNTTGGEVAGTLSSGKNTNTIGVIAKEWGEWIPALAFVPITATWVWVLDNKWRLVLQRAYPSLIFIDGFSLPLPAVDILLLSRVTLRQCKISLQSCPASLILSTTRLRVASGWVSKYWKLSILILEVVQMVAGHYSLYIVCSLSQFLI